MTLWDWCMPSVFWVAIFKFRFVSVSTGTKYFFNLLFLQTFAKGYDAIWTEEVLLVKKVNK